MNAEEWLICTDPDTMLVVVRDTASDRKFRLVVSELMRRDLLARMTDEPKLADARRAIELGELWADGQVTDDEVAEFGRATLNPGAEWTVLATSAVRSVDVIIASRGFDLAPQLPALLREVLGNPLRPAALDPAWLTSTVVALARGIYEQRAFDRMPILADALQDAGCTSDDILTHCRDPEQVHVRGCWVVDAVLWKV
jgi:hypothetical protein